MLEYFSQSLFLKSQNGCGMLVCDKTLKNFQFRNLNVFGNPFKEITFYSKICFLRKIRLTFRSIWANDKTPKRQIVTTREWIDNDKVVFWSEERLNGWMLNFFVPIWRCDGLLWNIGWKGTGSESLWELGLLAFSSFSDRIT